MIMKFKKFKSGGGDYPETIGPGKDPYDRIVQIQDVFLFPGQCCNRLIGVHRSLPGKNLLSFRYH